MTMTKEIKEKNIRTASAFGGRYWIFKEGRYHGYLVEYGTQSTILTPCITDYQTIQRMARKAVKELRGY